MVWLFATLSPFEASKNADVVALEVSPGASPQAAATSQQNRTSPMVDVYFINLARRPDREAHLRQELSRHGVTAANGFSVRRFNAVDGKNKDDEHLSCPVNAGLFAAFDAAGFGDKPNANVLKANSLSHLGVWRAVVASGAAHAIVLQDDAQLAEGFRGGLAAVVAQNPSGAFVTWLGLNGYASGAVSRSAIMKLGLYDPNHFSRELEGTGGGVLGRCRPGLIATGSLAYLLTRAGALALVGRFGTPPPPQRAHDKVLEPAAAAAAAAA
eukprot:CAMPEP_0171788700 /NCGR_PEP_ID=MMETSP0991-20121206/64643_1 /TAXON_ID=483369 /ORGANISM="non described non described, Strain CCMP2098" /LENGTH=268 /DNA_ID=CAMNT_0012397875 /DNA_START=72 /DNA_END=875 /DNA_ORIENTATION=-